MLYYFRRYPASLTIVMAVIYLSFLRPPSLEFLSIPGIDKLAHVCMYGGLSGMLWLEHLRNYRNGTARWHVWIGAVFCPIVMSGLIELLQEYCTTHRGGEWLDFLANTVGVVIATIIVWNLVRPRMTKF